MLNSRQNRKAKYAEANEAPVKNHWVKTNEFGKIGDCGENNYSKAKLKNEIQMKNLKNDLKAFHLWYKHTGSQNAEKLRSAVKQRVNLYNNYKDIVANYAEAIQDAAEIVEPVTSGVALTNLNQE